MHTGWGWGGGKDGNTNKERQYSSALASHTPRSTSESLAGPTYCNFLRRHNRSTGWPAHSRQDPLLMLGQLYKARRASRIRGLTRSPKEGRWSVVAPRCRNGVLRVSASQWTASRVLTGATYILYLAFHLAVISSQSDPCNTADSYSDFRLMAVPYLRVIEDHGILQCCAGEDAKIPLGFRG